MSGRESAKVHIFASKARFVVGAFLVSLGGAAHAEELQVSVTCPGWSSEASAQVEARIRTSVLAANLSARRVSVSCASEAASVEVEAEQATLLLPVVRRSEVLEDDVVATAEAALRELTDGPTPEPPSEPEPQPATASAAQPAPASAAQPVPAPPRPRAPARRVPAAPVPPAAPSKTLWQLQAGLLSELWDAHAALGGEAGVSLGSRSLAYGLALGGRAAFGEPESFAVNEWNASVRLLLAPPRLAGFRGSVGLGVSLLMASPARGISADSPTQVSVGYLDLQVSRPFSLGALALAPSLGARVFSARRDVQVNDRERLAVPRLVPQAALWLVFPGD